MPNLGIEIRQAGLHWVGLFIWLGGAIAGTGLILLGKLHRFWAVNLVTYGAFIWFFITPVFGLVDSVRQVPLRQIAETVISVREINEPIAMATNS
ncbi:MAG: glycosyltransferase, partial [Leptolyngbyaceae cyanobacterium SU_3_3]|nr:glycosyltransferase [Leptolyngbyaceae cyanobacterium SU_3_3]